ncbi:MAG TPA: amidophosphoribosyltransferase [Candidatus Saccharimonadales bacterium]|nr:amidophosphoribosyltransferase [Candidatus Saccharimonadales bacterium]
MVIDGHDLLQERLREECGVFGVFGHDEAANLTYLGLHGLQHRGQESAGIVSTDGLNTYLRVGMGQIPDVFNEESLAGLKGRAAAGHVRYSTAGESGLMNAQPMRVTCHDRTIAICHNGNLVNADELRQKLDASGAIFSSTSDTEVILHLIARSKRRTFEGAITHALGQVRGAYSLIFLTQDRMYGVRDPKGFRPLSLGRIDGAWVLTSESCALDLIGAEHIRELEPGEIVSVGADGVRSLSPLPSEEPAACIFEYVYFARPDSILWGRNVGRVRKRLGMELAKEAPADADIVVPIPDSGVYAALGYHEVTKIPFDWGLVRSHYVGRTFIEPAQSIRHFGVKLKLSAVREVMDGRRIVLIDDSIVRGTTSRKIVSMVREAGAREVHVRISCPPTVGPCYYGVDTPRRADLIAAQHSVEGIRRHLGADSLAYLSHEGLLRAVDAKDGFCTACYTNAYPISVPKEEAEARARAENAAGARAGAKQG